VTTVTGDPAASTDFVVRRDDLHECRFAETALPALEPGQALLAVDTFGLTANNVTYAVFGDAMSYWSFFPAPEGWGRVPVWGFADVAASTHDGLPEGARVYGYFPPSSHLVVTPARVDPHGFMDSAPHRAGLPATYNAYVRTDADPVYDSATEAEQMLLRPLFFTSWLLDDFLAEEGFFGAGTAVLSSASSKTALSAAFLLSRREGIEVVGLTSAASVDFVAGLGVYSSVVTYDDVASLPGGRAVYIDMSGAADVRSAVHHRYGEDLAHSAAVGATHWTEMAAPPEPLPGPPATLFFAPDRVTKRSADWGRSGLEQRLAESWHEFAAWLSGWLEVQHGRGPEGVEHAWREVLEGRVSPSAGHVLSLRP
jgi:catechol 2,3-dioxygenase-like lactoylglutathione lyase family enzyme